ncbi:hypothetical protein ACFYO2_05240 [Streptomyces sp. NPDC006602]|uniref:hypothetical protein n=1 Tax=Streptomyces sp. NPDC006602 TaxID=3364751 RepID=UPI003693FCAD
MRSAADPDLGPADETSIRTFDDHLFLGGWFLMFPMPDCPAPHHPFRVRRTL